MPNLTNRITDYELSAEAIGAFVDRLDGKVASYEGRERRAHARYVVAIPSVVWALDADSGTHGEPFQAATRDISAGGIGLVHTQPVGSKFLGVKLTPPKRPSIQLLVRVLRCKQLGAFYDLAGEFVTRRGFNT